MYFDNKEIDPRDCQYRANSKIRKQIEQVIRENKIRYGLFGEKSGHDDDPYRKSSSVKNRFKPSKNNSNNENKENQEKDAELLSGAFGKEQMVTFLEQLEALMFHEEEHKQAFSYNDLVKIHQLLQYMEKDPDVEEEKRSKKSTPTFRNQFFFQFMEDNFKVIQPEKRKNAVLDERIRKLKYQAARKDYDTMTGSVSRAFLGGSKGSKSSISQDIKNLRGTLVATLNSFMVIICTFAFVYFAVGYASPSTPTTGRIISGFSAAMVVGVAEIYFLIKLIWWIPDHCY